MKLIEVKDTNSKARREFLQLPLKIYQNDKNFIRPLDTDIENVFNRAKNPCFQYGDCVRWILQDAQNQTVGRIAAFYDSRKTNAGNEQPTGGLGFFECVNNQEYANLLFDTAKKWLQSKGMEAMDGPINFGDRSRWWGLLIKGFEEPNYCSNYNPPYYIQLFENYGFQDYFQQYTYLRMIDGNLGEKFYEKAERIKQNKSYTIKHIEIKNLAKYAEDFRAVYNASWVKHEGVAEMTPAETQALMNELKPVMDERLIWFAYYNDQPIAFMVMIPELNQLFKYVNGKLDWLGKLKFVYHRWRGHGKKILGLVIGIMPRFHGRGLESAMIAEFSPVAFSRNFPYNQLEFNWVGDFLPAMMHVYESLGAEICKTHITYRKLFDETKEFKRHPIIK
jgi:GNAT superfamily N-acetyltransferase